MSRWDAPRPADVDLWHSPVRGLPDGETCVICGVDVDFHPSWWSRLKRRWFKRELAA